jgi:Flp pilus assembly protein TadB
MRRMMFSMLHDESDKPPAFKRPGFIESFFGLLGAGIAGTVLFVLLFLVFWPVLLVFGIWLMILRYRMKKAMAQMGQEFQDAVNGAAGPHEDARHGRKRVKVTVTTVGPERAEPEQAEPEQAEPEQAEPDEDCQ